jgi:hypothetical protein
VPTVPANGKAEFINSGENPQHLPHDSCYSRERMTVGNQSKKERVRWVLLDLSNSNPGSRNYAWWFETKAQAIEHRQRQQSMPHSAALSEPQKWIVAKP